MATLVIQSFGHQYEYRRAIFAVLSFYAYSRRPYPTTILFTDNESYFHPYFEDLPIQYVMLTAQKIRVLRGSIDFLHRMKIGIIEEAFKLTNDNLLYADSDTFFIDSPAELMDALTSDVSYMHKREYAFESLATMPLPAGVPFRAFFKLIADNSFILSDNSHVRVDVRQFSWNAGVMMFHHSHAYLLPDVYALTEQFYPPTSNHASEQYAFSVVLQNKTSLRACDNVIYHYWYRIKKSIIDIFLKAYLTEDFVSLPLEHKAQSVAQWTKRLPRYLDRHILTLKDNAIQAFHESNRRRGYMYALKAFLRDPFDFKFVRDVLYHTKRLIK